MQSVGDAPIIGAVDVQARPIPAPSPYRTNLQERDALSFQEFSDKFAQGGNYGTEQAHPKTEGLSQAFSKDKVLGLQMLSAVDAEVIDGVAAFIETPHMHLATAWAEKLNKGGRFIFLGAGSSGRVGVDLAAKCAERFPQYKEQFHAIMAGGDTAFLRAKEGFEDKEEKGAEAIRNIDVKEGDTVILISASGSAPYLVGAGHEAANRGAETIYFYNNTNPPARTKDLFKRANNPVMGIVVESMPAIAGSTRLQPAVIAEACLGTLLAKALYYATDDHDAAVLYPKEMVDHLKQVQLLIQQKLPEIAEVIALEANVFSEDRWGCVTTLAASDVAHVARMAIIDAVEIPPTFSLNRLNQESVPRSANFAEFRCYLVGTKSNEEAFSRPLGRKILPEDVREAEDFLLAASLDGEYSFEKRAALKDSIVLGVASLGDSEKASEAVLELVAKNPSRLIVTCHGSLKMAHIELFSTLKAQPIVFEDVPKDALGLAETILWKEVLHLISNGTACRMNKILSNRMIAVSPANNKLVNRAMGLCKTLFTDIGARVDDETLYHYVVETTHRWKMLEKRPTQLSVVQVVIAMLKLGKTPDSFPEVLQDLVSRYGEIL